MNSELSHSTRAIISLFGQLHDNELAVEENNTNRSQGFNILGADTELDAISLWLQQSKRSPQTLRSYELESTRLILWAALKAQKSLSTFTQSDMEQYLVFLQNPDPLWCGPKTKKKLSNSTLNPHWRPFVGPLSYQSAERSMRVINSLFSFLLKSHYWQANPLATLNYQHPGSMGDTNQVVINALEQALDAFEWGCVIEAIDNMPQEKLHERSEYERIRFILLAFYTLGARIGELASHHMGHFRLKNNRWRWYLKGKGGKYASVPVSNLMVDAMAQYRTYLSLSKMPEPNDETPFFLNRAGTKAISARRVYDLIKELFVRASDIFTEQYPEKHNKLAQATPHWIRHTLATHLSNNTNDIRMVAAILRHSDLKTTMIYTHVDSDKQYALVNSMTK